MKDPHPPEGEGHVALHRGIFLCAPITRNSVTESNGARAPTESTLGRSIGA